MKHDIITQVQSEIASLKRITPDAGQKVSRHIKASMCKWEKAIEEAERMLL